VTLGQGRVGVDTSHRPNFHSQNGGRNIVIQVNGDGFQPFDGIQHSMTPFVLMILNLPENLRHKSEYLLLAGLVPGPKEPKDWNTYLKMLVDELKRLWEVGFTFRDPCLPVQAGDEPVQLTTVFVKLLNVCADLPALGHILKQQIAGAYHGCIKCHIVVSRIAANCCKSLRFAANLRSVRSFRVSEALTPTVSATDSTRSYRRVRALNGAT
jgi:hypothetical protein